MWCYFLCTFIVVNLKFNCQAKPYYSPLITESLINQNIVVYDFLDNSDKHSLTTLDSAVTILETW
jgi:hypothetical protein